MPSKKAAADLSWVSAEVPPMTVVWECFRHLAMHFWIKTESRSFREQGA